MVDRRAACLAGALAVLAVLVAPALPEAPPELRLVFSEPLEAGLTSADVSDEYGQILVERAGEVDPGDPFALVVPLPALGEGTYSVTWRTLSAADGHTVQGFFAFGVGSVVIDPGTGSGAALGETDALDVVGRWLTYVGLLAAVGLSAFTLVVLGSPQSRGLARLVATGLAVAGAATLVTAVSNAIATGDPADYLTGSRTGLLQVGRAAVCLATAAVVATASPSTATVVAIAGGMAGCLLLVAGGHAAALPGLAPIVAGVVHVAAAGVWLAGVVALALIAWRPTLLVEGDPPSVRSTLPRFSALALVSVGLMGATGVASAWWQMGAIVDADTPYGRTLILKTALALVAVGVGAVSYLGGTRAIPRAWTFVRRVRAEAALGATVLAVTAVLATTSPSDGSRGVPVRPLPDAFGQVTPGMSLSLAPGRPGVNRAIVETTDALAMSGIRLELALDRLDDGTSTRIELHHPGMEGMDHSGMADGSATDTDSGTVAWSADAIVLPAGGAWDANVLTVSSTGTELARQRFAFAMGDDGVSEGRAGSILTPETAIALVLVLAGAIGVGLAVGGSALPRCERRASRIALSVGGATGLALGMLIGLDALLRMT